MNNVKMVSFKNKDVGNRAISFLDEVIRKIQNNELSCMGAFFLEEESSEYETYFCTKNGQLELLGLIEVLKDSVIKDLNDS